MPITSPKRGKIRPRSAPAKRAAAAQNNQGYYADLPYDVAAINPDLWWDEICHTHQKFQPPPQQPHEHRMSREELTSHLRVCSFYCPFCEISYVNTRNRALINPKNHPHENCFVSMLPGKLNARRKSPIAFCKKRILWKLSTIFACMCVL